ncbi:hypothetical protein J6590_063187 [Homalodisca vitripennis]|nr:hypothetical protein J6590_063187 [Homalodisca vitripennis]
MMRRFEGDDAVSFIREEQERRRELQENCKIEQWLADTEPSCYVLYENNRALSFALLSGCHDDIVRTKGQPRFLNYIYTVEAQRNRGLATALLRRIKDEQEVTAVCWNDVSERIFYKTGYVIQKMDNGNAIYRYP